MLNSQTRGRGIDSDYGRSMNLAISNAENITFKTIDY